MTGIRAVPAAVAERFLTSTRKSGRYMTVPMKQPPRKPNATEAQRKTAFPKRRRSKRGAAWRVSFHRKPPRATAAMAKSPRICGEVQGYGLPTQVKARNRGADHSASPQAPA